MGEAYPTSNTRADDLLRTKLTPPRPGPSFVQRTALLARLSAGMERKCTVLSAPAGFGKTALVSAWLSQPSRAPVAWLTLDANDNDPVRFWRYVITACQRFAPASGTPLGKDEIATLRSAQQVSFDALVAAFINQLAEFDGTHLLVLEDYHVITFNEVHETVGFLLDHLPPTLHIVILTRGEPPLPLSRMRARNELNELNAADLRFTHEEVQEFLRNASPFALSPTAVESLEARTEGWPAGLRLAVLALQGHRDAREVEAYVKTFTGSHRHVVDYLVADVLSAQPRRVQQFLLQTTFLSGLTGSLCDAVTGNSDGVMMLEWLERENLFLLPLAPGRQGEHWYRYLPLFAEAVHHHAQQQLDEATRHALYAKASNWYEQHGQWEEAIDTALLAEDFTRAARLIEQYIDASNPAEELVYYRWIDKLPPEIRAAYPTLCFSHAMMLLFTQDRRAPATRVLVEVPLRMAERVWQAEGNLRKKGEVLAFRAVIALWQDHPLESFNLARRALELLPEEETNWRGTATLHMAIQSIFEGDPAPAYQGTIEAHALGASAGNLYVARAAHLALARTCVLLGELHQAETVFRQVLNAAIDRMDAEDQADALLGLGQLAYEWNDLDAAAQQAAAASDLAQAPSSAPIRWWAMLLSAQILWAQGQAEQAQNVVRTLVTQPIAPAQLHEVRACQARFALEMGDLATARRWQASLIPLESLPFVQREAEALLGVRIHMKQGEHDVALRVIEPWEAQAKAHGRTRSELEIGLLKALAVANANPDQAKQWLVEVLTRAQPEGYQRLFLDEGEPMMAMLRSILHDVRDAATSAFLQALLRPLAVVAGDQRIAEPPVSLAEPLSAQELRVLRLVVAGMSNPEIARELVVSINTVKTQVQSIYRKLNVNSREEARAVARRLNLR